MLAAHVHAHVSHGHAAFLLEPLPRRDVRVVVQIRHDDLVALAPLRAESAREVEGERRHVVAEGDLAWSRVEEIRGRVARALEHRVRLLARGIGPRGVRVVLEEIHGHGVRDLAGNLRAARSVEVGDVLAVVLPLQRGKSQADFLDARHTHAGQRISPPACRSITFTAST